MKGCGDWGTIMCSASSTSVTTTMTSLMWLVTVLLTATSMVSAKSETSLMAANKIVTAPFTACIDESDCSGLGNGYACFQG